MRVPAQQADLLVADRVSIDRRDTLAFVFCVEPGWLEAQACLLSESIRRFGGALADGPIYAVQARGTQPLHRDTIAAFTTLGVRHHAGKFNTELANVPTTNKVFAVTEIEQIAVEDFLVFLDTDTVLLDEPAEFLLPEGSDLGVQPTVRKFRGSTGIEDPNDPYWRKVYAVCDVPEPPYVRTMADKVTIRGYYNGGVVAYRRAEFLGRRWLDYLRRLDPVTQSDRHNLDQIALAALAANFPDRVALLPFTYNYNIARRSEFIGEMRRVDLDGLVHIHYHNAFEAPDILARIRPALSQADERYRWLQERLPLPPSSSSRPWRSRGHFLKRTRTQIRSWWQSLPGGGDTSARAILRPIPGPTSGDARNR